MKIIHIRKSIRFEMFHKRIYDALRLPQCSCKTVKTNLKCVVREKLVHSTHTPNIMRDCFLNLELGAELQKAVFAEKPYTISMSYDMKNDEIKKAGD